MVNRRFGGGRWLGNWEDRLGRGWGADGAGNWWRWIKELVEEDRWGGMTRSMADMPIYRPSLNHRV